MDIFAKNSFAEALNTLYKTGENVYFLQFYLFVLSLIFDKSHVSCEINRKFTGT